jgi:hypothetical protein
VNQGAQANSSQSEELASTADELAGLASQLSEEVGRFKLRRQQYFEEGNNSGVPGGITPEMIQAIVKAELQGAGGREEPAKVGTNGGNGHKPGVLALDRDERGYEGF